ncbi:MULTISPECIES: RNA 2',3'-cyclic phosphodiesterase [Bhargavaea]|uniref:RNA 2',3'-cyclic phosphodiesterase n=1 Tax=Bhargavaea changchunensis TaxID=2134037 RepID=A0ABW2NDV1_9BACL|nr:RNA 2',3'-cyclic phosphodiesterase [Bhargavaea sp. CC-171006]
MVQYKQSDEKGAFCLQQHYFLGVRIPSDVQPIAEKYLSQYRLADRYKVVSHPEDLHITLFYLGACDDRMLAKLSARLRTIAEEHTAFTIQIDGFNFFGPPSGPRVTYLSVTKNRVLERLQKDVTAAVTEVTGLPSKDRFVPHITIAKKRKTDERLSLSSDLFDPYPISVDCFQLFKVQPQRTPKYETVESFVLRESE